MTRGGYVILGGLLLVATQARAQSIHGRVVDDRTDAPIADVRVQVLGPDLSMIAMLPTDSTGSFLFVRFPTGRFRLRAEHPAYASVLSDPVQVSDGETVEVQFRMSAAVIPLEPLVVVTRRESSLGLAGFHARARDPKSAGRYITRDQIELRPGSRPTEFLRDIPGIRLTTVPDQMASPGNHLIRMRGGTCSPTLYIDGLFVPPRHAPAFDDMLNPEMIEGAEIYTMGNTPPGLEPRTDCGVVAFWTRPHEGGGRWGWAKFGSALGLFLLGLLLAQTVD